MPKKLIAGGENIYNYKLYDCLKNKTFCNIVLRFANNTDAVISAMLHDNAPSNAVDVLITRALSDLSGPDGTPDKVIAALNTRMSQMCPAVSSDGTLNRDAYNVTLLINAITRITEMHQLMQLQQQA